MRRALACACVRVVCVFVKGKGVADWVLRKIFELLDERAESGTHHHTREGEGQARPGTDLEFGKNLQEVSWIWPLNF